MIYKDVLPRSHRYFLVCSAVHRNKKMSFSCRRTIRINKHIYFPIWHDGTVRKKSPLLLVEKDQSGKRSPNYPTFPSLNTSAPLTKGIGTDRQRDRQTDTHTHTRARAHTQGLDACLLTSSQVEFSLKFCLVALKSVLPSSHP